MVAVNIQGREITRYLSKGEKIKYLQLLADYTNYEFYSQDLNTYNVLSKQI